MSRFLERIRVERYGALSDYELGPLGSGLNVVYGPNEAGKSTMASFIGGVLFGWEEARGVRNTYRPAEGDRTGSLQFADPATGESFTLSRGRNEDGLQGDAHLVADLDHATYRTMFSLTSDELRSLRNTSDVTARLLTAGSATGSSPAAAFVELEQRIAAKTSRAEDAPDSIVLLGEQMEAKRAQVDEARRALELSKQEDRERADLAKSVASAAARLDELNDELEALHDARARVESLDVQTSQRNAELEAASAEYAEHAGRADADDDISPALLRLDSAADRSLRDKLEELADEQAKVQRGLDVAKEDSASSSAAYEALSDLGEGGAEPRESSGRRMRVVVPTILTLAFIGCGVPLFVHGRVIRSLSFTALGASFVVFACLMAIGAFAVLLRPSRGGSELESRRKDAQWVMLQDKRRLEVALAAKADVDGRIAAFLEGNGMGAADGSLRQARSLLDAARDQRARNAARDQRLASLELRRESAREALAGLASERSRLLGAVGLEPDATAHEVDAFVRRKSEQRDALSQALADMGKRFGELDERLAAARENREFDRLKLEYQELRCRLRESKHELVVLLLAKRMLEKSIAAWESRSQPEVYAQASRLFALLTDGAWTHVSMTGEGRLVATASDGAVREVRHLSLGTCQQLYLALRMAMLLHADAVGVNIPVLADDVLVNFDASRRRAAARALVELAAGRQVIVFTCHRETVAVLREACENLTYIEL